MGSEELGGRDGDAGTVTELDWFDLEQRYREVFGENIPRMMLPADEETAAALVLEAIDKRDETVLDRELPGDALI